MKTIAIIPAKGNSRGLPGKNIKPILGKPLIAWSIEVAAKTPFINEVYVSSDSDEILRISEEYGAKGILRPKELAQDHSPSEGALVHALDHIEDVDSVDYVFFLQATSPIRDPEDLERALKKLIDQDGDSLLTVMKLQDHFIWRENDSGDFVPVNYDYRNRKPRQQIQETFLENGSFYIFKPDVLKKYNNRLGGKITYYELTKDKTYQIDDMEDFKICEHLITKTYEEVNER